VDLSDESETTNAANRNAATSKTLEEAIMKGLQTVEKQFNNQLQKHTCPSEVNEGAEQFTKMTSSSISFNSPNNSLLLSRQNCGNKRSEDIFTHNFAE
jgi:hypothetical protein